MDNKSDPQKRPSFKSEGFFDRMSKGRDLLIDHFMSIGLDYKYYKDENITLKNLLKEKPILLCKFPEHNSRYPFKELNDIILKNIFIQKNIPFVKNSYMTPYEPSPIMKDYVVVSDRKPQDEFHTFSINQQTTNDLFEYPKHYACLIVFEEANSRGNQKLYLGKALVISSIHPYFTLFYKILNIIKTKLTEKNAVAIEIFIINLILSLEKPTQGDLYLQIGNFPEIILEQKVFLPLCDLNLLKFFSLFSIEYFLILAEKYLKKEKIYVFSKDITLLQPTMSVFLSLMFPLNITFTRDYYPLLLIDDATYKNIYYDSADRGQILLINTEFDQDHFEENFQWNDDVSIIIVDLDNKNCFQRIKQLYYSDKVFEIEGVGMKLSIPPLEVSFKDSPEIIKGLKGILDAYQNTKMGYYEEVYKEDIYDKVKFIRKCFFTYFCKIINFYCSYVLFEYDPSNNGLTKSFVLQRADFLSLIQTKFPRNVEFYSELLDNIIFNMVANKEFHENDPDLYNYIFMEEIVKVSMNKQLVYLDPYIYVTKQQSKLKIQDRLFTFVKEKDYFFKYEKVNDRFSGKIAETMKITYQSIPHFLFDFFSQESFILPLIREIELQTPLVSTKDLFLINELTILKRLIENQDIVLELERWVGICYILILCLKINSLKGSEKAQKKLFKGVLKCLDRFKVNLNFIYSFIYEIVIGNDFDRTFELEYFNKIRLLKVNPSYFIVYRNRDKPTTKRKVKSNIIDLTRYLNLQKKIVTKCKLFKEDTNPKSFLLDHCSFNNNDFYCKCNITEDIWILIKLPDRSNEEKNSLFSPIFLFLKLLEFIQKSMGELCKEPNLEDFMNENVGYFEVLIGYFLMFEIELDVLCEL